MRARTRDNRMEATSKLNMGVNNGRQRQHYGVDYMAETPARFSEQMPRLKKMRFHGQNFGPG